MFKKASKKRKFINYLLLFLFSCIVSVVTFWSVFDKFGFIKKNSDKAIIIVPGIGCSTLHYNGETNRIYKHGECVFFRGDNSFGVLKLRDSAVKALKNYKLLMCDKDGSPSDKDVGLLKDFNGVDEYDVELSLYGFSRMFKRIINYLKDKYGEKTKYKYKVYLFNYDWRLSNEINASRLYNELKKYGGGVILIGFSMGNLVSSRAMVMLHKDKDLDRIKTFISIFPPYNGSLLALTFLKTGVMENSILFNTVNKVYKVDIVLRKLALNYQSMYELLPTKLFFRRSEKGALCDYDDCSLNYRQFLSYLRNDRYINRDLLNGALRFHQNLLVKGKHILNYVKNKYFFLGTGFKAYESLRVDRKRLYNIEPLGYSDGDGTVNLKCSAYPPCDVDIDDVILIKERHNSVFENTLFLVELSDLIDMYV